MNIDEMLFKIDNAKRLKKTLKAIKKLGGSCEIYKDGFRWHPECKNLAELKAFLIIETPDTLAKKYCMETFTGTGLHNIPKFFMTQTISWWLGTMMAKGIYFDFDAFKYDDVIEIFKALGKKVYETYA